MSAKIISSVGKKELVAITGLSWAGFLAMHLLGNCSIYFGSEIFDKYGEHLHTFGILLLAAELGLLAMLLTHIVFALWLTVENFLARPIRYQAGRKNKAGLVSKLMPYTGLYMLVFIAIHVYKFRLTNRWWIGESIRPDSIVAGGLFSHPGWVAFYCVSVAVVALHVLHGLWSGFQTLDLGMTGRRNFDGMRKVSIIFCFIVAIGFGVLPLIFHFASGLVR